MSLKIDKIKLDFNLIRTLKNKTKILDIRLKFEIFKWL